ncbi:hypothetical protein [Desulfococcus sp.]|uniref:hypothetical protein n=1 Tax=Desulfococcus sp. TaxID=2025834 RepID=UPI0035935725
MASRNVFLSIFFGLLVWIAGPDGGSAADPKDMGGWEVDGAYNRLYKGSERDRLKGIIEDVKEVVPLAGMSAGVALVVKDEDGDRVLVHLGPRWFVDPEGIGVRKGDEVKIRGAWADVGGEDVFIASKVKRSEFEEYKVRRTRDGYPFWSMSAEELEREKGGD